MQNKIIDGVLTVNGKEYTIVRLLGKGKGGYSYLATDGRREFTVKQIHHEPCEYYSFGDKLQAELNDYARIKAAGVRMPELIDADRESERIVKEYIRGETAMALVKDDRLPVGLYEQVARTSEICKAAGINLDWFPTNFIDCDGELYYIDYECNEFSEQWSFENWGRKYWSKTPELIAYLAERDDA